MDILTNLQEYGVIGAASTIVLMILKYNGKQGWKLDITLKCSAIFIMEIDSNSLEKVRGNILRWSS